MIGGNLYAKLQKRSGTVNAIGEMEESWEDSLTIKGWLDLSGGDSKYNSNDAKIQESTHIFLMEYMNIPAELTAENTRLLINGKTYDVMLIDDPMERHRQIEIYLKYTGGQDGEL